MPHMFVRAGKKAVMPVYLGTSQQSAVGAAITVPYPAESADGDFLVCAFTFIRNAAPVFTVSVPAGWTTIMNTALTPSQTASVTVIMCRFRGEETSAVITASTAADSMSGAGGMAAYAGSTVSDAIPISSAIAYSAGGTTTPTPTLTTTKPKSAILRFVHTMRSGTGAFTHSWASPATEIYDLSVQYSTFARFGHSMAIDSAEDPGTVPSVTVTETASLLFHEYAGTIAIPGAGT